MNNVYASEEPLRAEINALRGPVLLEFGSPGCSICRAAQPIIAEATEGVANLRHIKVEDASGRKLGRSFNIKLWPTLVFLKDGQEVGRLVRPTNTAAIKDALKTVA